MHSGSNQISNKDFFSSPTRFSCN